MVLNGLTEGIRVNGVAPGPIWTPLQISGGATHEKIKKFNQAVLDCHDEKKR